MKVKFEMYSKDRMNFIIEYMSAYEQRIKVANKNGLFDSAKMFELFAQEICGVYFNQKFHNLNNSRCNFPYFDLISDDGKKYIQVSTNADISTKIKNTLENIRDSKEEKYSNTTDVYFFVLYNDTIKRVKNYIGKNQIGNIPFDKSKNLVTTQDIIIKAQNDLNFQEKIYTILKQEFENFNEITRRFSEAIDCSKNVGIKNIDTKINDEYEIDRSDFLMMIKEDNYKFISIQGAAGSGKSVMCKKYLDGEELILYARAERFVEENHLENIWNFDIKTMLEFLNGKKIIFFIDALEFIADASKSKLELFESLYDLVSKYENAYIITSCRTTDKNAFIKLESNYAIKSYEVGEITKEEFQIIKERYTVIDKLSQNNSYDELFKIPFYINIVLTYSINPDDIDNINKLRDCIWENIICLKSNAKNYNVKVSEVTKTIEKIVFDRAKDFVLGINENNFDSNIISALISEGIVISNKEGIRLKYDIFEDICFEQFFDREFFACKGKYDIFYKKIECMGRCVYRRYQIWISNKLFLKESQDKFIHSLVFSNSISDEWKKQTEIGITKSNYCERFFEEKKSALKDNNLLEEFINIINVYCFDVKIDGYNGEFPQMILVPTGMGRENIIKIIYQEKLYFGNTINKDKVVKLCLDYSNQNNTQDIDIMICSILECYVNKSLEKPDKEWFNVIKDIDKCLQVLFKIPESCTQWLKDFFSKLINYYNNDNNKYHRISEEILEWIVKNVHYKLVKGLPNEMCSIANVLWITKDNNKMYYHESMDSYYGLCDHYRYSFQTLEDNTLLWNLFRVNFYIGLDWAIDFINKSVEIYVKRCPECVIKTRIWIVDTNEFKEYYGNNNMWLASTRDGYVPDLLSDIVFNIKDSIISFVKQNLNDKIIIEKILAYIKDRIYLKSNNVILLTVIESLGLYFKDEVPGYALDLASSINVLNWDTHRYTLYLNNPQSKLLEKQLLSKVGLPKLKYRYELDERCGIYIEDYVIESQLYCSSIIKEKVYRILDYLYSFIKNDEENAIDYLQIQKMDMRNAKVTKIDNNTVMLESKITGEAKKVVDFRENDNKDYIELNKKIKKYIEAKQNGKDNLDFLIQCINEFCRLLIDDKEKFIGYETILICLISIALKDSKLSKNERNNLCNYWINGIEKIFNNESFVFESQLISILIDQIYEDIEIKTKNSIKEIILKCIINSENDGIIEGLQKEVTKFLKENPNLSRILFNTIIKLSEDEMNHQKYNAKYVTDEDFQFVANITPKLYGIDRQIEENNGNTYISLKNQIIDDYLFKEKDLNISKFNIDDYDIKLLYKIVDCGMTLNDDTFEKVLKELLKCMIKIWNICKNKCHYHDIIDTYQEFKLIDFIQRELVYSDEYSENVIDFLFKNINFNIFQKETIEFYQNILSGFISEFYDSYNNSLRRNMCKKKILQIEKRVINIKNKNVKRGLYKCLFFNASRECRWNPFEIKTAYSYEDKVFLNTQFSKYGKYHVKDALRTLYLLNINELLPEILISIRDILLQNNENESILKTELKGDGEIIINMIIIKAFTNFIDKIKLEDELIDAYEDLLNILITQNNGIAGVLLDEFRVH